MYTVVRNSALEVVPDRNFCLNPSPTAFLALFGQLSANIARNARAFVDQMFAAFRGVLVGECVATVDADTAVLALRHKRWSANG